MLPQYRIWAETGTGAWSRTSSCIAQWSLMRYPFRSSKSRSCRRSRAIFPKRRRINDFWRSLEMPRQEPRSRSYWSCGQPRIEHGLESPVLLFTKTRESDVKRHICRREANPKLTALLALSAIFPVVGDLSEQRVPPLRRCAIGVVEWLELKHSSFAGGVPYPSQKSPRCHAVNRV